MAVHTLSVALGATPVGTISNLSSDHNVFTFDPRYLDDADRPTLSLGFLNEDRTIAVPTKTPQMRLLPFFSNLLPEGHLRQYLANRARVKNPARGFPLLWVVGEDLPGAVVARNADGLDCPPTVDESLTPNEAAGDASVLKFSLAGVQLKFSAIAEARGGLTIPAYGQNGDWVLKMPSAVYRNVPENEFAMMTFARAVGIDVPEIGLVDPSSVGNLPSEVRCDLGRALRIKRFDRADGRRIHTEDFNQIYNQYPEQKYENASYRNMLANIWQTMGADQSAEFVRRLVFNIGIGNGDMHLKNWSVIYPDGREPRLSPAYDYVATVAYIDDDALALSIAGTKRWDEITEDRMERFARRAGVPRGLVLKATREMVARMRDVWPALKGELDVPEPTIARIDRQMDAVPIFGGHATLRFMSEPHGAPEEVG
jgi:serine/threonine-protein kinase HipA